MNTRNRSEFAANVSLNPDTLQAMRSNHWTVGRTFTRAAPVRPAAHTVAQRESLQESVTACSRELMGYASVILASVSAYLVLISI